MKEVFVKIKRSFNKNLFLAGIDISAKNLSLVFNSLIEDSYRPRDHFIYGRNILSNITVVEARVHSPRGSAVAGGYPALGRRLYRSLQLSPLT